MRLAIVGTGISGLTCAWLLAGKHELVVYEADERVGGHSHTVDVDLGDRKIPVDTGFIVFNPRNYPAFSRILERLAVPSQAAEMSFSVSREDGFEYGGGSLAALFAQPANGLRPWFLRMCLDVPRFYRKARAFLDAPDEKLGMQEFMAECGLSRELWELHVRPMCAAIWSTDPAEIGPQPAAVLLRFLANHGLLQLRDRPQWRTIRGGSRRYVEAISRPFRASIRRSTPVASVHRARDHVQIADARGGRERFDQVVIATHSDQALALLADPSDAERHVLGSIRYQRSEAFLHTDASALPRSRRAWSSWNYRMRSGGPERVRVTYWMNRLQSFESPEPVCVTLNDGDALDPRRILRRLVYEHPLLDALAVRAQAERAAIDGVRRTHYCGAWWRHGFHEDGVQSALEVCRRLGAELT